MHQHQFLSFDQDAIVKMLALRKLDELYSVLTTFLEVCNHSKRKLFLYII